MNRKPHKAGQPQPQGGRANPNFKPEKAQPSPRERSPTHTQEKEGPNNPREGRANPLPKSGKDIFVNFFYLTNTIMSLPILPKKEGPTPTSSLLCSWVGPGPPLQDRAWPLTFLSFWLGPWPSLSPLFGWLSPLGPGQPRPEGPTLTRDRRPTPIQGREGQPDGKGQPQTGKGRGNPRSENCQHLPKEEGPTSTPRK